ncbi:MAG TPA: transporter [Treponema sp.]|nr:transporter [Treponema sp.]
MHLGFLLYSFYTVTGKIASRYEFLSLSFCLFYILLIGILFIYAVLWQQILKTIRLSFATANKAISIVWGMLWSLLFFNEEITFKKITGAIIIILGIIILSATSLTENKNE